MVPVKTVVVSPFELIILLFKKSMARWFYERQSFKDRNVSSQKYSGPDGTLDNNVLIAIPTFYGKTII